MFGLKQFFAVTGAVAALAVPCAGVSSAATADQNGLVNVYARNILNHNKIVLLQNVSIGVAAAFCNINVNVLSTQLRNNQRGNCPAKTNQRQKAWVAFA